MFRLEGVDSNLAFLQAILAHEDLPAYRVSTRWLGTHAQALLVDAAPQPRPRELTHGWHAGATAEQESAARKRMAAIQDELKRGASFDTLASDSLDTSNKDKGGDLGWVSKDSGNDSLLAALFALPSLAGATVAYTTSVTLKSSANLPIMIANDDGTGARAIGQKMTETPGRQFIIDSPPAS